MQKRNIAALVPLSTLSSKPSTHASTIALLQQEWAEEANPLGLSCIEVVVLTNDETLADGTNIMQLNLSALRETTSVIAVILHLNNSYSTAAGCLPQSRFLGFVRVSTLAAFVNYQYVNSLGAVVPHVHTNASTGDILMRLESSQVHRALPLSATQSELKIDASFDWYKTLTFAASAEMDLDSFTECVLSRMALYTRLLTLGSRAKIEKKWMHWGQPGNEDDLSTADAVLRDRVSYSGVLLALFAAQMHAGEARSNLFRFWLSVETRLSRMRLNSCTHDAFRTSLLFKTCERVDIRSLPDSEAPLRTRLKAWAPFSRFFYKLPFEKGPQLLSLRQCIMYMGCMYITASELAKVAATEAASVHTANFERARLLTQSRPPTLPARILRVLNKVVVCLVGISRNGSNVPLGHPLAKHRIITMDKLLKIAPQCIQKAHKLATQPKLKQHLTNDWRVAYSQFLLFMGWSEEATLDYFRPGIHMLYDKGDATEKEYKSSIKYVHKRLDTFPISCGWFAMHRLCPHSEAHSGNQGKARSECQAHLAAILKRSKHTDDIVSPVNFVRTCSSVTDIEDLCKDGSRQIQVQRQTQKQKSLLVNAHAT